MAITFDGSYDRLQRAYGDYLATEQTIPANTRAECDEGTVEHAGGTVEFVVEVNSEVSLGGGKTLTLTVYHATYDSSTYYRVLGTVELSLLDMGTQTYAAGKTLLRFALPSHTWRYQKAWLATDDVEASGKLNVFPVLLPR